MPNPIQENVTISWWLANVAKNFMTFTFAGGVWGAFNPFPVTNTKQILEMQNVGKKFIPLPPFSSLASVGYYAGMCGSIAAVQSFTSGGLTAARGRQDVWNEFFGVAAVYGYATFLLKSEKRMSRNNRAMAGITIGSIVYANASP